MLKKLYIKNFALIDEISVDFQAGLNIITGETGAGKSIIINAINLLLGEKAKTDMIRQGFDNAIVEGEFIIAPHLQSDAIWNEIEMGESDILIIRIQLSRKGRTRSFVNDSPVSNAFLSETGNLLVDLHGQHEHQALFKSDYHLTCLDNFGVDATLLENVRTAYQNYKLTQNKINELKEKYASLKEKKDFIEFQLNEIGAVNPDIGEDLQLEREEKILQNSETLIQTAQGLKQLLYDGDFSVYEKLTEACHHLNRLTSIDDFFTDYAQSCKSAQIIAEDIAKTCQSYVDKIDFDSDRLEKVRERLIQLNRLKKKYGSNLQSVSDFYNHIKSEFEAIETMDHTLQEAENQFQTACRQLADLCDKLSDNRKALASQLENHIKTLLSELGMVNNQFQIQIGPKIKDSSPVCLCGQCYNISPQGWDKVEFLISLNLGESMKKLKDVASGGEISRIMLALKKVLADADAIPILVFDEIDSGISGRIARIVGQNLKELSRGHQIICITHLPQIASLGDYHLVVQK